MTFMRFYVFFWLGVGYLFCALAMCTFCFILRQCDDIYGGSEGFLWVFRCLYLARWREIRGMYIDLCHHDTNK